MMTFDSTFSPDVTAPYGEAYRRTREVVLDEQVSAFVPEVAIEADVAATEITMVPLSQLVPSALNVRTVAPNGIRELAANIQAVGVLQNLVVHVMEPAAAPAKSRKAKQPCPAVSYGVAAGRRRFSALQLLLGQGKIDDSYAVPVKIVADQEALLVSLSENQQREGMHPADQICAFAALKQQGRSIAYISAVFGVSELRVSQYLKLAGLSPELMDLLRGNAITLEQLYALALSDDHATQNRVWFGASTWDRQPQQLRARIVGEATHTAKCRAFTYIGAEAFQVAGGFILRDLFGAPNDGYINDIELVERLAAEKMAAALDDLGVTTEGWSWIEFYARGLTWDENEAYSTLHKERSAANDEQAAALARIDAEEDRLQQLLEADDGEDEASLDEEFEALQAERENLDLQLCHWTDAHKACGGVLAFLDGEGQLVIQRGRVRKADYKAALSVGHTLVDAHNRRVANVTTAPQDKSVIKAVHSEKLVQQLTAHRTAAVQAELIQQPNVALAVLAHRLACRIFEGESQQATRAVKIQLERCDRILHDAASDLTDSPAWCLRTEVHESWRSELPEDFASRVDWLVQWEQDKVVRFLAYLLAQSINGVRQRDGADDMDALVQLLNMDMHAYWQPTQAAYFDHITKMAMVQVVAEAVSADKARPLAAMKKAEAAAAAAQMVQYTGWLPMTFSGWDSAAVAEVLLQDNDTL